MPGGSARGAMLGRCGNVDRLQSAVATRGVRRAAAERESEEQTPKCDSRDYRSATRVTLVLRVDVRLVIAGLPSDRPLRLKRPGDRGLALFRAPRARHEVRDHG